MAKNKKKKKHSLLITLIILIPLLLVGLPIGLLYGLFYDATPTPVEVDENFNQEAMLKRTLHNSIENTKVNQSIALGLGEDDMNQLLLIAMDSMNEQIKKYVDAPYVRISPDKESFDLYVHLDSPIFKTRLKLSTTLKFQERVKGDERQGILFKINEISIGKTNVGDFAMQIVSKYVNDQFIDDTFSNAGFNIKCSLKEKSLFYSADDLVNDVMAKGNIDPIFGGIIDLVMDNGLIGINYSKDLFGLTFKYSEKLLSNGALDLNREGYSDVILNTYMVNLEKLLNDGIISEDKSQAMLDYLTFGYDEVPNDIKTYVSDLDLTSIDINNPKLYEGLNNNHNNNLTNAFVSKINSISNVSEIIAKNQYSMEFDEITLNEALSSTALIGKSFPLVLKDFNNKYHVNSIFIDDFYINIFGRQVNFIIGININGLRTNVIVPCEIIENEGLKVTLKVGDIHYGMISVNEEMKKACLGYMDDAISNLGDWFNKIDDKIIMNLENCIKGIEAEPFTILKSKLLASNVTCLATGTKASDNGALEFTFNF